MDFGVLTAACEIGRAGKAVYDKFAGARLSDEEKELLSAAAEHGRFRLMWVDQYPDGWVRVISSSSHRDFFEESDPACAARYLEALRRLRERGLVNQSDTRSFSLTGSGFTKATSLVSSTKE